MSSTGRSDSRSEDSLLTPEPTTPGSGCAAVVAAVAVGSGGAAPVGSGGVSLPVAADAVASEGPWEAAGGAAGPAATAATPPAAGSAWSEPGRGALVAWSERWNRGFSCLDSICPSALGLAAFQVASSTMEPVAPSRTWTTASWDVPLSRVVTRTTASSFIPSASAWYAGSVPRATPYFCASSWRRLSGTVTPLRALTAALPATAALGPVASTP